MPWGAVQLKPGVDTQLTLAANQAGVSQSQLIRYQESLIQTYGGWVNYIAGTIASTVRDLHAWQGIGNSHPHLSIAATGGLSVYHSDNAQLQDITPQKNTTNPPPNFSVTASSNVVTVVDAGSSASVFNTVYFNTPVALAGFLLNGAYKIASVLGSSIYTIVIPTVSSATVASSGILPKFTTTANSATVTVTLPNHGFQAINGLYQQFIAPTTVDGIVVGGKYQISSVIDATSFTITATQQASAATTATMNASLAQLVYYITIGPPAAGFGFGAGAFGGTSSGGALPTGFGGTGTASVGGVGTPITAIDWTQDNWGEVLLACPQDGPIYAWAPDFGFQNAQVITQAPFFNGGIFVSMPQQILVAWRSTQSSGVQDPLVVRWCNAGDYTNWTVSNQTTAGSFHLPTGSTIIGGIQCPVFGLISTDADVWTMTYVGGTVIFNFNRVGSACSWIGSHACGVLAGIPYWMSLNNFFMLGQNGVTTMPCTVWDQVFQNLTTVANQYKIRVAVNSAFNEVAWFYPSAASVGENDSYVKVHIEGQEFEWDYGSLTRTAWLDASILGMPIGTDNTGAVYQHETGTSITGAGLPTFRTGWFTISEAQDIPFIDFIIPDFIWGTRSGLQNATVAITFFGTDYIGNTPFTYGPFIVSATTPYVNCRIRNRFISILIQSNASSEFWRLGRVRFRFAQSGRR